MLAMRIIATILLSLSIIRSWIRILYDEEDTFGISRIFAIITIWVI
jgi:hypothetical protein